MDCSSGSAADTCVHISQQVRGLVEEGLGNIIVTTRTRLGAWGSAGRGHNGVPHSAWFHGGWMTECSLNLKPTHLSPYGEPGTELV